VVVDDEPSKTRGHADNLLWIPTYNVDDTAACAFEPSVGLNRAIDIVLNELAECADVRDVLPRRVVVRQFTPFLPSATARPAAASS
jgi:hypothetical protein